MDYLNFVGLVITRFFVLSIYKNIFYSWVIEWNITSVTLISENNKSRILNTLFKVKLLALVEQLLALLKRKFPYAFFSGVISRQVFFQVFVSSRFRKTIQKTFSIKYQTIVSRPEQDNSACFAGRVFWKKGDFSRRMSMLETCFSNVTLRMYENKTPPWKFSGKCFTFFGVFSCLVSQIIIILMELCQGNYLSVIVEIL